MANDEFFQSKAEECDRLAALAASRDPILAELQELLAEYLSASVMVGGTLRIEPAGQQIEDAAMARFMEADAKIAAIIRRIEGRFEIDGRA